MFLVYAEQNRLRPGIGVFEEFCEVFRNDLVSYLHSNHSFKVRSTVQFVRDLPFVAIYLPSGWSPSFCINGCDHPMDSVWGEETILDSLAKAVAVDRVSEITVGNFVLLAK